MYYLLNWNDEYLDNVIVGAKETKEEIREAFKEHIMERLIGLNIVKTEIEAADLWFEAESKIPNDDHDDILHVYETGGSILYGSGYTDHYHIVEFFTDPLDDFEKVESDDYCYYIGKHAYAYTGTAETFEFAPVITFDLQYDEETIAATFSAAILPKYFHPDVLKDDVLYPAGMEDKDPADVTVLELVREKAPLIILFHEEFVDTDDLWDEMDPVQDFLTKVKEEFPKISETFNERMGEPCNQIGTPYEALVDHILHNTPLF